jgi:hypothetical protein
MEGLIVPISLSMAMAVTPKAVEQHQSMLGRLK